MADEKIRIVLPQIADTLYAPELYAILQESFESRKSVEIDASQSEKVSTAVIQLILSANKSYSAINKPIHCTAASEYFRETCDLLLGDHKKLIKD